MSILNLQNKYQVIENNEIVEVWGEPAKHHRLHADRVLARGDGGVPRLSAQEAA
jgi:hypothetical protein